MIVRTNLIIYHLILNKGQISFYDIRNSRLCHCNRRIDQFRWSDLATKCTSTKIHISPKIHTHEQFRLHCLWIDYNRSTQHLGAEPGTINCSVIETLHLIFSKSLCCANLQIVSNSSWHILGYTHFLPYNVNTLKTPVLSLMYCTFYETFSFDEWWLWRLTFRNVHACGYHVPPSVKLLCFSYLLIKGCINCCSDTSMCLSM